MGRNPASRRMVGHRDRQRGAAAVWVGGAIVALIAAALLAFDIGRLYYDQRQLQNLASLAAISAAPAASGCVSGTTTDDAAVDQAIASLLAPYNSGTRPISVMVEYGRTTTVNGLNQLRPITDLDDLDIDSVRVTLTRPRVNSLLNAFFGDAQSGNLRASATARQAPLGSLRVGSGLLNIDTSQSELLNPLLSGLLGGSVNLTAVDYEGLASVDVSLEQLAIALGVDVQDLSDPLSTSTSLPFVLDGLATVLDGVTGTTGQNVSALLRQLAVASAGNATSIPLVDLLGSVVDTTASAVPALNLMDLVLALGASAAPTQNGEVKPIALPVALSGIDDVASAQVFIQILEPPQLSTIGRAGRVSAKTAQIRLMVRLQVAVVDTLTDVIRELLGALVTVNAPPINLGIDVEVASGEARLDSLQCPRLGMDPIAETSAISSVAEVSVGTFAGTVASAPPLLLTPAKLLDLDVSLLSLFNIPLLSLNLDIYVNQPVDATVGNDAPVALDPVDEFTFCAADADPVESCRYLHNPPRLRYWRADNPGSDNPQTIGTEGLLESTLSSLTGDLADELTATAPNGTGSQVCVLGICIPLSGVIDLVLDTISGIIAPILASVGAALDVVVDLLLDLLGIQLGTATVTMENVVMTRPAKVSTCIPGATPPPAGRGCVDATN